MFGGFRVFVRTHMLSTYKNCLQCIGIKTSIRQVGPKHYSLVDIVGAITDMSAHQSEEWIQSNWPFDKKQIPLSFLPRLVKMLPGRKAENIQTVYRNLFMKEAPEGGYDYTDDKTEEDLDEHGNSTILLSEFSVHDRVRCVRGTEYLLLSQTDIAKAVGVQDIERVDRTVLFKGAKDPEPVWTMQEVCECMPQLLDNAAKQIGLLLSKMIPNTKFHVTVAGGKAWYRGKDIIEAVSGPGGFEVKQAPIHFVTIEGEPYYEWVNVLRLIQVIPGRKSFLIQHSFSYYFTHFLNIRNRQSRLLRDSMGNLLISPEVVRTVDDVMVAYLPSRRFHVVNVYSFIAGYTNQNMLQAKTLWNRLPLEMRNEILSPQLPDMYFYSAGAGANNNAGSFAGANNNADSFAGANNNADSFASANNNAGSFAGANNNADSFASANNNAGSFAGSSAGTSAGCTSVDPVADPVAGPVETSLQPLVTTSLQTPVAQAPVARVDFSLQPLVTTSLQTPVAQAPVAQVRKNFKAPVCRMGASVKRLAQAICALSLSFPKAELGCDKHLNRIVTCNNVVVKWVRFNTGVIRYKALDVIAGFAGISDMAQARDLLMRVSVADPARFAQMHENCVWHCFLGENQTELAIEAAAVEMLLETAFPNNFCMCAAVFRIAHKKVLSESSLHIKCSLKIRSCSVPVYTIEGSDKLFVDICKAVCAVSQHTEMAVFQWWCSLSLEQKLYLREDMSDVRIPVAFCLHDVIPCTVQLGLLRLARALDFKDLSVLIEAAEATGCVKAMRKAAAELNCQKLPIIGTFPQHPVTKQCYIPGVVFNLSASNSLRFVHVVSRGQTVLVRIYDVIACTLAVSHEQAGAVWHNLSLCAKMNILSDVQQQDRFQDAQRMCSLRRGVFVLLHCIAQGEAKGIIHRLVSTYTAYLRPEDAQMSALYLAEPSNLYVDPSIMLDKNERGDYILPQHLLDDSPVQVRCVIRGNKKLLLDAPALLSAVFAMKWDEILPIDRQHIQADLYERVVKFNNDKVPTPVCSLENGVGVMLKLFYPKQNKALRLKLIELMPNKKQRV